MNASEPMVSAQDIAGVLQVSKETVIRWAREGVIPSVRIGREPKDPKKDRRPWRFYETAVREAFEPKPKDIWEQPKRALIKRGRAA